MAYVTAEARQELLADVAEAIDELDVALGALGAAYEQLDEPTADVLEAELFRPVQVAYGRAQRTHAGFAERYGLAGRAFVPGVPSASPHTVRQLLDTARGRGDRGRRGARPPAGLDAARRGRRRRAARRARRGPHAAGRGPGPCAGRCSACSGASGGPGAPAVAPRGRRAVAAVASFG